MTKHSKKQKNKSKKSKFQKTKFLIQLNEIKMRFNFKFKKT